MVKQDRRQLMLMKGVGERTMKSGYKVMFRESGDDYNKNKRGEKEMKEIPKLMESRDILRKGTI